MPVLEDVKQRVKTAMRSGNVLERDLLRTVISSVDSLELRQGKPVTDDQVYKVMKEFVETNNKTLVQFAKQNGQEVAEADACQVFPDHKLSQENAILVPLIPQPLSLDKVVAIAETLSEAIKAAKDVGPAIGVVMAYVKKSGDLVDAAHVRCAVEQIRAG
jgi:uncharacterized protein YqeY